MRKLLFLFGVLSILTVQLKADGGDLFDIQEDRIKSELSDLTTLEEFVIQNDGITLSTMQNANNPLTVNIITSNIGLSSLSGLMSPMADIPAFLWGFCLGPIGVVIVFITDEDDVMMSIVGCLVSSVLYGGGYLLL